MHDSFVRTVFAGGFFLSGKRALFVVGMRGKISGGPSTKRCIGPGMKQLKGNQACQNHQWKKKIYWMNFTL